MENLFYWVIENVGIVEIIEEFWSLWHSFASWLYEIFFFCEKCMKWKKNKIVICEFLGIG